ncbi:hypothetical protein ABB37_02796 [Leptomonas pyrrhocoris]|uniref:Uncharacterized protein n=1 Tax=Leptomonas pyrrhocoris TaxID=157538 RepID=A0A0N0DXQ5_LEPPY|nr:hypothetical protein ABB37_02796 [Leptomonas pyrrhocoris]XP_015661522.1 hypothetical protein ABB37_02796 [Leptomonas pyrrhocoris]XP_015661523.1 hypothetical protein ABB37_02796 [Leptomonas pyrrhocoris]KPA83082.1 hypothetical protein ABB37_02796 [Leptomonas pyrrhocoris]KPA83083.1 hypothetical protein ABB37_02796 [Leptomonas pyrrhocoris]KPA83084.1 hypothetical protein ABB37_02796 [Leptomonas pyrrhocoris]|eukprot:XP_015661521.1 hypothetical protein ABB37_02796 [Leptomonas pyrrhocoris]
MSIVRSPTNPSKRRFSSPTVDGTNDAERQLCDAVDATLSGVTRLLQQSVNENAKVKLQGTAASFLRANGIRLAQENADENAMGCAVGRGASGDKEAVLRTELVHCRDLLRKVDGERRYARKQWLRLQAEQEQRRTAMEAMHRYSTASHQRSLTLEQHVAEERQRRRQLEEQLDTLTQELMQLRRVLRALPGDLVTSISSPQSPSSSSFPSTTHSLSTAQLLVPDRRFEEAFRDKMNSIVYKRRYQRASALHQAASEQLEAFMMGQQDLQHVHLRAAYGDEGRLVSAGAVVDAAGTASVGFGDDVTDPPNGADSSSAASLASAVFWQSALDFPFQLPFSTATPQDALIKSLIYRSQFAEPLTQLREHTLRLSTRLKTTQDTALRTLYLTFNQALQNLGATPARAQCRSLYERQMSKMQRAHRELLYGLIEQVNHATMEIPEAERRTGGLCFSITARGGDAHGVQRRDAGCTAHESVSIEEYRSSQLKEQLTKLKLQSLETAAATLKETEATAAQCTAARQEAVQALQSLKKLTACIIASVRAQKTADEVVYDPLEDVTEPLTEDVLDDPRLVTKMTEATDLTLTYVRQLARNSSSSAATSRLQASSPRVRTNLGASVRLSSSLTFGRDSDREGTYGNIIDIHRRDDAFSEATEGKAGRGGAVLQGSKRSNEKRDAVVHDRRKSAPSSLSNTARRMRRKSVATANRRLTVPQLPAVPRTPTAPTAKRGTRGRPEPIDAAALHTPPLEIQKDSIISFSSPNQLQVVSRALKETGGRLDGSYPNPTVSIIELGFSENSIRLN